MSPVRATVTTIGVPSTRIEMATLDIPDLCHRKCTWVVVRPGQGWAEVSRLKYQNGSCPHHRPRRQQEEAS